MPFFCPRYSFYQAAEDIGDGVMYCVGTLLGFGCSMLTVLGDMERLPKSQSLISPLVVLVVTTWYASHAPSLTRQHLSRLRNKVLL